MVKKYLINENEQSKSLKWEDHFFLFWLLDFDLGIDFDLDLGQDLDLDLDLDLDFFLVFVTLFLFLERVIYCLSYYFFFFFFYLGLSDICLCDYFLCYFLSPSFGIYFCFCCSWISFCRWISFSCWISFCFWISLSSSCFCYLLSSTLV